MQEQRLREQHKTEFQNLDVAHANDLKCEIANRAPRAKARFLPWSYAQLIGVSVPAVSREGTAGLVLSCVPFTSFVLRKRIVLGRASRRWRQLFSHAGLAPEDFVGMRAGVVDIHLSDDPAIARRHAVVMWNEQHRAFFIRRLSEERSIFIDGIELPYDSAGLGCPLRSGALVQIGHCCFVFLLPVKEAMPTEKLQTLNAQLQSQPHSGACVKGGSPALHACAQDCPHSTQEFNDAVEQV